MSLYADGKQGYRNEKKLPAEVLGLLRAQVAKDKTGWSGGLELSEEEAEDSHAEEEEEEWEEWEEGMV
ncbi:hypothetical protein FOA52_003925 [Chlamydomonas sp. UWO 241]|nr:hypothetical protein FOA52_003925 [Chlamydomonas sp. UWO 241]